ncbi:MULTISPECIES: hypothetical protein [unclassified Streptomyces]|uniref:hypothetical protein n=1 Tax=unclassified Streptomyces TaxID=2593676 RepID=UPI001661AAD0|nr:MULTISPECIES: hypothetical protein [unclassified Streptomyces]MBD0838016.1 hypothetical protein [Streptomyces sp. TRM68416]
MDPPSWLRPGPKSPNLERSPDPESVYDELGASPGKCSATLGVIKAEEASATEEDDRFRWQVLHGLAEACMALQGQNGSWEEAAKYFAATEGRLGSCKSVAAHAVLGEALRFHAQHPSATVRLRGSGGDGTGVCAFRITEVTAGGPGERITVSVSGAHFSTEDLISATLCIDGKRSSGGLELVSRQSDGFSFTAEVPTLDAYPKTVDVAFVYGSTTTKENALTVEDPGVTGSPPAAELCDGTSSSS